MQPPSCLTCRIFVLPGSAAVTLLSSPDLLCNVRSLAEASWRSSFISVIPSVSFLKTISILVSLESDGGVGESNAFCALFLLLYLCFQRPLPLSVSSSLFLSKFFLLSFFSKSSLRGKSSPLSSIF